MPRPGEHYCGRMMSSHPSSSPSGRARTAGGGRRWWIVGGACACAVILLLAAAAAGGGIWYFAVRETPEDVVAQYLEAWEAQDCETFEEVSTEHFRGEDYTCEAWSQNIAEQSDVSFDLEIGETTIHDGRAAVRVTELSTDDAGRYRAVYDFILIRDEGDWRIDTSEIVEEHEEV